MTVPDLEYERELWSGGYKVVLGMDEVGRGCFAGPLIAASVSFAPNAEIIRNIDQEGVIIRDSKKMTPLQRERANEWIVNNSATYGIGVSTVDEINEHGIVSAVCSAFRRCMSDAQLRSNKRIEYLLIDGNISPYGWEANEIKGNDKLSRYFSNGNNQLTITRGDSISVSIAASSIVAKVYRDNLMKKLAAKRQYKVFFWHKNKGYGTHEHRQAILRHGTSDMHRRQFVATFLKKQTKPEN